MELIAFVVGGLAMLFICLEEHDCAKVRSDMRLDYQPRQRPPLTAEQRKAIYPGTWHDRGVS